MATYGAGKHRGGRLSTLACAGSGAAWAGSFGWIVVISGSKAVDGGDEALAGGAGVLEASPVRTAADALFPAVLTHAPVADEVTGNRASATLARCVATTAGALIGALGFPAAAATRGRVRGRRRWGFLRWLAFAADSFGGVCGRGGEKACCGGDAAFALEANATFGGPCGASTGAWLVPDLNSASVADLQATLGGQAVQRDDCAFAGWTHHQLCPRLCAAAAAYSALEDRQQA